MQPCPCGNIYLVAGGELFQVELQVSIGSVINSLFVRPAPTTRQPLVTALAYYLWVLEQCVTPMTLVCYTAVFSVVTWGGALRDDAENGCVADYNDLCSESLDIELGFLIFVSNIVNYFLFRSAENLNS